MVVSVEINGQRRSWPQEADPEWINQQINKRRADGQTVWVLVTVQDSSFKLSLATPGYPSAGGRSVLSSEEQAVVDLWRKLGLSESGFTGGNVVAFLKQLVH